LGYFALNRATQSASSVAIPEIKVDPTAQRKTAQPPAQQTETTAQAAREPSMGQVSTELVPPTTDGLSPARKISTTRIIVENDLEVRTLK
jgi:hypothetical protein